MTHRCITSLFASSLQLRAWARLSDIASANPPPPLLLSITTPVCTHTITSSTSAGNLWRLHILCFTTNGTINRFTEGGCFPLSSEVTVCAWFYVAQSRKCSTWKILCHCIPLFEWLDVLSAMAQGDLEVFNALILQYVNTISIQDII